jgi:hypothetical protein
MSTNKELNVARVLKQLVYILEENDFVLYYDKRFESLKPQIDDEHDYIYHESYDGPYSPVTYLQFRDSESKVDYHLDYRDVFTHTLHYSKYLYPMPQNPFSHKMETYLDPYKVYSEIEAKELAENIYNELMNIETVQIGPHSQQTKYREFTLLTKEPPTQESITERIYKELEPHYGTVFLDEPFYPSVEPLDETKCTISITPDLQIKVSVTSEEYPRKEHRVWCGVHIQYCEYDENTQELVEQVGVKYSTDKTIESPLVLHATIQELLERIKTVKN